MKIKICLHCKKEFLPKDSRQKFCSRICSGSHYHHNHTEETKLKISNSIKTKSNKKLKYNSDAYRRIYCPTCGQIKEQCKYPNLCNHYIIRKKSKILEKLGFDFSKVGSLEIYKEYDRIYRYIFNEYNIKKSSLKDICIKHNLTSESSICKIMDMFNINRRDIKNSIHEYLKKSNCIIKYKFNKGIFKHGLHTTWDNFQVYYRSSYELNYCNYLDNLKIHYEMENLRIEYYDTRKNKYRIAIPDFYIPSKNLIIEIKSNFTYDKQNMIDKFRSYKKHQYNYKLILEGKDYGKKLCNNIIDNVNKYW